MTPSHDLPALDELGRRLAAAQVQQRAPSRWSRRTALAATLLTVIVVTPAVASITGLFGGGGETFEEALPGVVDQSDPVATGQALERRGFKVRWMLIDDNPERGRAGENPTIGRKVGAPPPGTEILSMLDATAGSLATPESRSLLIEVAPAGSEILRSHR